MLLGSDTETTTTGTGKHYKLSYDTLGENIGWYWGANDGAPFTSAAHKAWLVLPAGSAPNFGLPGEEETTGIKPPTISPEGERTEAFPREGLDGVWYTLDGRKLNGKPTQKGLYIVNGRKTIVK